MIYLWIISMLKKKIYHIYIEQFEDDVSDYQHVIKIVKQNEIEIIRMLMYKPENICHDIADNILKYV